MARDEHRNAFPGDAVAVEYARFHPELCRLSHNISRRHAVVDLVIVAFMLLYGLILMPYMVYAVLRKKDAPSLPESQLPPSR